MSNLSYRKFSSFCLTDFLPSFLHEEVHPLTLCQRDIGDNCYLTQWHSTGSPPMHLHQLAFIRKQGRVLVTSQSCDMWPKISLWQGQVASFEKKLEKKISQSIDVAKACVAFLWYPVCFSILLLLWNTAAWKVKAKSVSFTFLVKHGSDPTNRRWLRCWTNFAWFSPRSLRRENTLKESLCAI